MKITIVNAWGENRGDEAMLRSLVAHLDTISPGGQVGIFTAGDLDLPRSIRLFQPNHFPSSSVSLLVDNPSPRRLWNLSRELTKKPTDTAKTARQWVESSDLVISAPAGPYLGDGYPNDTNEALARIDAALKLGRRVAIAATSAGPFSHARRNSNRRRILAKCEWWTVRESLSFSNCQGLKIPDLRVVPTADIVYARVVNEVNGDVTTAERVDMESLNSFTQEPTLGVTINTTPYIDEKGRKWPFDAEGYQKQMVEFLTFVQKQTNARLLFFPHHYGHLREMRLLRGILSQLSTKQPVRVVPPQLNSDCQQLLIARLAGHISHRYHPGIFAIQQGVPVFYIVHQFKSAGMLKDFGYPIAMPNTMSPTQEWCQMFLEFWKRRSELAANIAKGLPEVRRRARVTYDLLSETLGVSKSSS